MTEQTIAEPLGSGTLFVHLVDGRKEGEARFENSRGELEFSMEFAADELNGAYKRYYSSGHLMFQANYMNGELHGLFVSFFESGVKQFEVNYCNGVYHGIMLIYDEFGDILSKTPYDMGVKVGKALSFYPKVQGGGVRQIEFFENGLLNGDKLEFNEKGQIISVTPYKLGRPQRYPETVSR